MVNNKARKNGRMVVSRRGQGALVPRIACSGMAVRQRLMGWFRRVGRPLAAASEEEGQGTTEYAILVGVLVVIAIAAVLLFRGRLEALWGEIADGINSL